MDAFISDGVKFVGVMSCDAELTKDIIDGCVVGDDIDDTRHILTASHKVESVEYALKFARSLTGEFDGEVQLVEV